MLVLWKKRTMSARWVLTQKAGSAVPCLLALLFVGAGLFLWPVFAWADVPPWAAGAPPAIQNLASALDDAKYWLLAGSLFLAAIAWGVSAWWQEGSQRAKRTMFGVAAAALLLSSINWIMSILQVSP